MGLGNRQNSNADMHGPIVGYLCSPLQEAWSTNGQGLHVFVSYKVFAEGGHF